MKNLLGFMLAIFFIGCIAGCSKNKNTVAIPKPNLPTAIEKVNKNMTGNILKSQELEDELNYRRTDRSEPLYVSITDRSPIEVFKEVGNTSVENSKGKYINIKMAEVGDKRSINGEDWLLLGYNNLLKDRNEKGEFQFPWSDSAQWFGVEKVIY